MVFEITFNVRGEEAALKTTYMVDSATIASPKETTFIVRKVQAEFVGIVLRDRTTNQVVATYVVGGKTIPGSVSAEGILFRPPLGRPELKVPKSIRKANLTGFIVLEMSLLDGVPQSVAVVESSCKKIGSSEAFSACDNVDFATEYAKTLRYQRPGIFDRSDRGDIVRYRIEF